MTGRARPEDPLAVWCQIGLPGCDRRATNRHHRKFRSRGGLDDEANTVDACGRCHEYLHKHDRWAKSVGLSISRHSPHPTETWERPDDLEPLAVPAPTQKEENER